jgi:hypothetical protein
MSKFTFTIASEAIIPNGSRYHLECTAPSGAKYRCNVFMGKHGGMTASAIRAKDLKSVSRMTNFGQTIEAAAIKFVREAA